MSQLVSTNQPHDQLIQLISPWVTSLGYRVIHIEIQTHLQKILRVFIDHPIGSTLSAIGIEDCVRVSKALDEQLDQLPEIQALLPAAYELEVSSPGVDRPLRTFEDFEMFTGKDVRIHIFRPLTIEEIENATYQEKNPKQKNFLGTLVGVQSGKEGCKIVLSLATNDKTTKKKSAKKSETNQIGSLTTNSVEGLRVAIPLPLISKANLEPLFEFEGATKESHEL